MKIVTIHLILLTFLFISINCKKDGSLVEPPTTKLPSLVNNVPVILTSSSVELSGKIDLQGNDSALVYFEYGLTTSYGASSPVQKITKSGTFNAAINNLTSRSLYHWHIYCKTTDGIVKTSDSTFTTIILPLVTNLAPSNLTLTSAIVNGKIDFRGSSYARVYFEYGLTATYGSKSPEITMASFLSSNSFNSTIINLTHGTTYHWRIGCISIDGNTFSNDTTFTIPFGVEFQYPLNIGHTWTYIYRLYNSNSTYSPWETQTGIHIWQVMSKNSIGDSTVYNLICTEKDTIVNSVDTTYLEQSIPFTIVVTSTVIYVHYEQTVQYAWVHYYTYTPIPRFVMEGTTQVSLENVIYLNGTGLFIYGVDFGGGMTGWHQESMTLIQ